MIDVTNISIFYNPDTMIYECPECKGQLEFYGIDHGPNPMFYEYDLWQCTKCKKIYKEI